MNNTTTKIIPPRGDRHTHTKIFLHGRDSNAEEFASELFESEVSPPAAHSNNNNNATPSPPPPTALLPIRDALPAGIRWVFPQAPSLPSARFGGAELTQWFDMHSTQDPHQLCEEQLLADGRGGFAGLAGLCGWMPLRPLVVGDGPVVGSGGLADVYLRAAARLFADGQADEVVDSAALRGVPIHLQHNQDDGVVPVIHEVELVSTLRDYLGFDVEWKEHLDGGHWLQEPDGADALASFIRRYC
ncbi:hypothetical protein PspLS_00737 [Pyricularia sp. CBS 133598]|nr:hypothetical protein PspLS_00737 [Pyricularia sp. CBS 133598]